MVKHTSFSLGAALVALMLSSGTLAESRTRYVVTDYRGSPVVMVGENGVVLNRVTYSPFGEETRAKRDYAAEHVGFDGGLRIGGELTELLSVDGRPYSPLMQRYLTPVYGDPFNAVGEHPVSYHYEENSPLRYVRPQERVTARQGPGNVDGMPIPALPEMSGSTSHGLRGGVKSMRSLSEAGVPLPGWLEEPKAVAR